jgi:hypothetical protein
LSPARFPYGARCTSDRVAIVVSYRDGDCHALRRRINRAGSSTQRQLVADVRETGPVGTSLDFLRASPALESLKLVCVAIENARSRRLQTKRDLCPVDYGLAVEKFDDAGLDRHRLVVRDDDRGNDGIAMIVEGNGKRRRSRPI